MRCPLVLFLFLYSMAIIGQEECPDFESWEKYYIPEGIIECPPDTVVFFDDFNVDGLDTSKWYTYWPCEDETDNCPEARLPDSATGAANTIRRDENVVVEDSVCKLITTMEDTTNNWYEVYRDFNGGFLQAKGGWNFATFEAKIKANDWPNYWETFWLWNHDENRYCGKSQIRQIQNKFLSPRK